MPSYEILAVSKKKPIETKYGPQIVYTLDLCGPDNQVLTAEVM